MASGAEGGTHPPVHAMKRPPTSIEGSKVTARVEATRVDASMAEGVRGGARAPRPRSSPWRARSSSKE